MLGLRQLGQREEGVGKDATVTAHERPLLKLHAMQEYCSSPKIYLKSEVIGDPW